MAFRQYTSCVSPGNYVDLGFNIVGISQILLLVLSMGFVAFFLASLLGGPAGIWIAIALDTSFIIYFYWWLHGRLICLSGDQLQCLIGVITGLGPSNPLDKGGDNDFTMNLLLASGPTNFTFPNDDYWHSVPQGQLLTPNPQIFAIGRGYVTDDGHKEYIVGMHCEFEGDGIYTLLLQAIMILALLIAALAFPAAAIALAILAALLFLFGLFGDWLLASPGGLGAGTPTDIDPSLGTMARGDIVVIKGNWIYDSLHPGWHEIHAVHDCQIIGHMDLPGSKELKDPNVPQTPWPLELQPSHVFDTLDFWCRSIGDADGADEGGSRDNPQNDWVIHPIIDGCNPVIIT
jgi:hypothetical protein